MANVLSENPVSEQYRKLQIDSMPIIEFKELKDYKKLLDDYLTQNCKPFKPVNRRSEYLPPKGTVCPICNAPYEYVFDNTAGRGQLGCKVCHSTFSTNKTYLEKLVFKCPHCMHTLTKVKDRKQLFITNVLMTTVHFIYQIYDQCLKNRKPISKKIHTTTKSILFSEHLT